MTYIPKKIADRFTKSVPKFQKVLKIAKNRDVNESDTVSIITDILAETFGYDKYLELTSEFAIRGTYCDIAIKLEEKVEFLLEAKAIGIDLKEAHIKQAIDYGANHGIQWVILTNGVVWRLYRIRFERPINFDLVFEFDFMELTPRTDKSQELLMVLSKEGLPKNAREDFFERVQCVNRYIIGNLVLSEPVVAVVRRELRKFADGIKVSPEEVANIIKSEVLKREIVEGEDADLAMRKVAKFYKKSVPKKPAPKAPAKQPTEPTEEKSEVSFSDQLLQDADKD